MMTLTRNECEHIEGIVNRFMDEMQEAGVDATVILYSYAMDVSINGNQVTDHVMVRRGSGSPYAQVGMLHEAGSDPGTARLVDDDRF